MNNGLTDNELRYIIERMLGNAADAVKDAATDGSDFTKGRKFAYYEMLDTIKSELRAHGQEPSDYGLDMNLEQKIL